MMDIVWITGANGFIGQHLSRYLANHGVCVSGLGHGNLPPDIREQRGLTHWINGDVDSNNLQQLLTLTDVPQVIYHLAGGSSVGPSLQTPAEDFRRSVVSTAALLEWMRVSSPDTKLVVSSSAAVYGDLHQEKISELCQFSPYSPYGFHKRSAELICESYAQNFGLKIAIVRLFSVYGPGLCKQLLWDLCCRLARSPNTLELQGTGAEVRDWLYVDDVVKILVTTSQLEKFSQSNNSSNFLLLNGATGIGTSVSDVATSLCHLLNFRPEIRFSGHKRPGDPFSLVGDTTRLNSILNIQLNYSLDLGLSKYVQWFNSFQHQ